MATSTVRQPAAADSPEAPQDAEWAHWPAAQGGWNVVWVLAAVLAASGVAGWRTGSAWCGVLAAGMLLVSLANYLLPIRYEISSEGVAVQGTRARTLIKWSRIESARLREDRAVLLVSRDGHSAPREFQVRLTPGGQEIDALRRRLLEAGVPLV